MNMRLRNMVRRLSLPLATLVWVAVAVTGFADSKAPVFLGVSGPLTGDYAQYGAQWKKGFDLALAGINGTGGIGGRQLAYVFEDSQSDPRQSVTVAQKFVADRRIIAELGDFASTASMAASPIYQRAKLVQLGFTNSHPKFTEGGDYMWSNSTTQKDDAPSLAGYAVKSLGFRRLAVFYLNTDWGKSTFDLFSGYVKSFGGSVVNAEPYLPSDRDFRSAITNAAAAAPDAIVLISYDTDGALIARQLRDQGLKAPIVADAAIFSPEFIKVAGAAAEGVYTSSEFFADDTKPEVVAFTKAYRAKYNEEPDLFAAIAYDSIHIIAEAIRLGGATRKGVRDGLARIRDLPSVIYGRLTFAPDRRVAHPQLTHIIVKNGRWVVWQGK